MKTDILFYKLFEMQPSLAFRLAKLAMPDAHYTFQSVELKQPSQRPDGVLMPDTATAPVLVLEVQFWREASVYTRLVSETAMLRLQYPDYRRWQMLLILPSRSLDVDAETWQALKDVGVIRAVYLDEEPLENVASRSSEEQAASLLLRLTVSPPNLREDASIVQHLRKAIASGSDRAIQKMFRNLFVSFYFSKYKTLTIEEIYAMIDTTEIFDDIHESVAIQQYAQQYAQENKLESVPSLLQFGLSIQQIAEALKLPVETIEAAQKKGL